MRRSIEGGSATALMFLDRLPRWILPVLLGGLLVAGLFLRNPIPLAIVAVVLAWLAYVSWPALSPQSRLLRIAGIGVLIFIAIVQLVRF